MRVLEDEAELAQRVVVAAVAVPERAARDGHVARRRLDEPGEDPQHRRLAAARLADERDELLAADAEVDAGEGEGLAVARPVALGDAAQLDLGLAGLEQAADAAGRPAGLGERPRAASASATRRTGAPAVPGCVPPLRSLRMRSSSLDSSRTGPGGRRGRASHPPARSVRRDAAPGGLRRRGRPVPPPVPCGTPTPRDDVRPGKRLRARSTSPCAERQRRPARRAGRAAQPTSGGASTPPVSGGAPGAAREARDARDRRQGRQRLAQVGSTTFSAGRARPSAATRPESQRAPSGAPVHW